MRISGERLHIVVKKFINVKIMQDLQMYLIQRIICVVNILR